MCKTFWLSNLVKNNLCLRTLNIIIKGKIKKELEEIEKIEDPLYKVIKRRFI